MVLVYIAYDKREAQTKKGIRILSIVLTVLLSTIIVLGRQLDLSSRIDWAWGTLVTIGCLGCLLYIVVEYVMKFCDQKVITGNLELTRKQKLIIFGVILGFNLLIFLAAFPGIYSWDASMQAYHFLNNEMNRHYSVLLSAVFGGILGLGKAVCGSYMAGVAMAMLLQLTFMSYVYAQVVYFVTEYTKSKWWLAGTMAFFTLNLIMGLSTVYATQDIMFGGIFALIFMELYRLAKDSEYWSNKWRVLGFVILGFLLCACRNNGVYVLGFVLLVAAFVSEKRKRDLPILALPIILSLLYTGPFLGWLGVPNTDSVREMMSIPSQQLARVYVLTPGALTDEEKAKIEDYYKKEKFVQYEQLMAKADPTKGALNGEKVEENWGDYIKLWLTVGLKSPKAYVEAFLLNSLGFWYPNKEYNDPRAAIPYIDYLPSRLWSEGDGRYAEMRVDKHSLWQAYDNLLFEWFDGNGWQGIPILASLTSMGTYFVLFLFVCGMTIYRKRKDYVLPLSMVLGNYIVLLLAPVAVFRYCYPMIIVVPIMFMMLFQTKSQKRIKATKQSGIMKKRVRQSKAKKGATKHE